MPLFFFDMSNGGVTIDDTGTDFPHAHAARDGAIRALLDVAKTEMGKRDSREVEVLLRDETGKSLFTATLKLTSKWLVETA